MNIQELWEKFPAEIKVALYLAVSYGLSAVVVELGKLEVNNIWLAIALNIFLVFLKELKPRIDRIRDGF
jgi:hypothetical protein